MKRRAARSDRELMCGVAPGRRECSVLLAGIRRLRGQVQRAVSVFERQAGAKQVAA